MSLPTSMGHTLFIAHHQVSVWQRNEAGAEATWERMSVGAEGAGREGVLTGPVQSGGGWATGVWGRGIKQWGRETEVPKEGFWGLCSAPCPWCPQKKPGLETHRKPRALVWSGCVLVRGGCWETVLKMGEGCWGLPPKVHVLILWMATAENVRIWSKERLIDREGANREDGRLEGASNPSSKSTAFRLL